MEKKMNILMIPTWYSPANAEVLTAGVFHYEQSMALKKYCNMALYYPFDTDLTCDFAKSEERGLLTYRSRLYPGKIVKYAFWIRDFMKIRKEFQPDIIHAHVASMAGRLAIVLGKIYKIPVVITEHNAIELMGLESKKMRKINQFAYHNSRANVCVSSDSMNRLKTFFSNEQYQVIHNGIINPNSIEKSETLYAKAGRINCCIVAAFYSKEIKGYQYLLPAMKRLLDKNLPITLHICGGGDYFDYYVNMAEELGISENCIFYGNCNRNKVYDIIRQMDFSISASIFECSGVSVQEAMLLGKPLVVTKSGGANSLVNEDTAIVVERESTEALVEGIEQMVQRLSEFDEDKIKSYAFVNFEIDEVSKKYVSLYSNILKE